MTDLRSPNGIPPSSGPGHLTLTGSSGGPPRLAAAGSGTLTLSGSASVLFSTFALRATGTVIPAQGQPSTLARAKDVWANKLTTDQKVALLIALMVILNHDALTIISGILFK